MMNGINWAIVAPILILQLILMASALWACIKAEETSGPKWMWVLIIGFGGILGSVAFFVAGRRNG